MTPDQWSLQVAVVAFTFGAAATVWGGVRLSTLGDILADRTGWGEALFGTVLLGAATSLSGLVRPDRTGVRGCAGGVRVDCAAGSDVNHTRAAR